MDPTPSATVLHWSDLSMKKSVMHTYACVILCFTISGHCPYPQPTVSLDKVFLGAHASFQSANPCFSIIVQLESIKFTVSAERKLCLSVFSVSKSNLQFGVLPFLASSSTQGPFIQSMTQRPKHMFNWGVSKPALPSRRRIMWAQIEVQRRWVYFLN